MPAGACGVQGGFTVMNVVKLVLVFTAWYGFNIYFNIYNKQLLKMFPFPISCTAFQFLGGSCLAATMWLLRLHAFPQGVRALRLSPASPHAARDDVHPSIHSGRPMQGWAAAVRMSSSLHSSLSTSADASPTPTRLARLWTTPSLSPQRWEGVAQPYERLGHSCYSPRCSP